MRFCFLFFVILLSAFQSDNKILFSENKLLSWDDFKGKPNAASSYKALTETQVSIEIKAKGTEATLIIQNYFDKDRSWSKDKNNLVLLSHEQTHFNISELWARKFRQSLKGKSFRISSFQKELNSLHSNIHKESMDMQAEYDKETEHSVNQTAQQKWNKKITNELQKLSAFSSVEVTCKLLK